MCLSWTIKCWMLSLPVFIKVTTEMIMIMIMIIIIIIFVDERVRICNL